MAGYYPGTRVTYNGVRMWGVKTLSFDQELVRDESNTDVMYSRFTISVESIVTPDQFVGNSDPDHSSVGVEYTGDDTPNHVYMMRWLHKKLSEDRKEFIYEMNGEVLVSFQPRALAAGESAGPRGLASNTGFIADADNGPKVQHVRITHFTPRAYRVQFAVVVSLVNCTTGSFADWPAVISNRWSVGDVIGEHFTTTRTWRGKLRVSSAVHNPQAFRWMVVPPISKGFKRTHMSFQGEPNSLELSYQITDQEMIGDSPPRPAIAWSGTHTETVGISDATTLSDVSVRLEGAHGVDKQVLLQRCMAILDNKLHFDDLTADDNSKGYIRNLVITDHFGDGVNAVEARMSAQRIPQNESESDTRSPVGMLILQEFAKPLTLEEYEKLAPVASGPYPSSLAGLWSCALKCACCDQQLVTGADTVDRKEDKPDEEDDEQPIQETYTPTAARDLPQPDFSQSGQESMYVFVRVESRYHRDHGWAGLPVMTHNPNAPGRHHVKHFRLHQGSAALTVKLQAERIGKQPEIWEVKPFEDSSQIRYYPMHDAHNIRPPEKLALGNVLYVIDQEATFSLSRMPTQQEMTTASLPWRDHQPELLAQDGILDPTGDRGIA